MTSPSGYAPRSRSDCGKIFINLSTAYSHYLKDGGVMKGILIAAAVLLAAGSAAAANYPCSGKKGGIDRCQGDTFICVDGSVSASKKSCIATMGSLGVLGSEASNMTPAAPASKDCSCRGGSYCTGPRGGQYCLKDDGGKSYLRK